MTAPGALLAMAAAVIVEEELHQAGPPTEGDT